MNAKDFYPGVFSRNAAHYRARAERLMKSGEATSRFALMDAVRPRRGMRILDLACGPGTITIPMAREMAGEGEVIGVDLADGMLEAARAAALGKGLPVRFLKMDIEVLQFPPHSFDAVTCAHGLQFAPNLGKVLREARRVLKIRGKFAASVPTEARPTDPSPAEEALELLLDTRLGKAAAPEDTEGTRALVNDPDRFQSVAVQAGLRAVEVERIDSETSWENAAQYVTMSLSWWRNAARTEGLSATERDVLVAEATRAVEEVVGTGSFMVPSHAYLLKAEG